MIASVQTAAAGASAAQSRFAAAAGEIAQAGLKTSRDSREPATRIDLSEAAVASLEAGTAFAANVAVMRTGDALQKRLLDIVA